ncbi:MAG TPA: ChbG/HpnK family deacetylase [Blastocatellia bacterium]|nr:ChbG/HpnK family deacetylase [Blastocatellia bacterium]
MRRLIINADDFGFTRSVNAGIVRAFREGIVTSTTILANGDAFEDAAEYARTNPGLGVGCHLSLVGGRPVAPPADVPSLVDERGMMPGSLARLMIELARGVVRNDDIERELGAQIQRVIDAGISPTHLDTHKHSHVHPRVMAALARVANQFGIKCVRNPFEPVKSLMITGPRARVTGRVFINQWAMGASASVVAPRIKRLARARGLVLPDHFRGVALTGLLDGEAMRKIIKSLAPGTTELMCHPGAYDADLERSQTRLKRQRESELDALLDPALRRLIEDEGVTLISYRELREAIG